MQAKRIQYNKEAVALIQSQAVVNGLLQPKPAEFYRQFSQNDISAFCLFNGYYCLPTIELVDYLNAVTMAVSPSRHAIEIGSGNGVIARSLGITGTDSKMQDDADIAKLYALMGQPPVTYGDDVVKLDANAAVDRYKPEVVIGAWVTHKYEEAEHDRGGNMFGIDESAILDHPSVKAYLVIGNESVHSKKPILNREHVVLRPSSGMLFSRGAAADKNVIYVWAKDGVQLNQLSLPS